MSDPYPWSEQSIRDARPWVRWWWLGSALTEREITREIELLADAGFGGVEVQPIYAADVPAAPSVEYLSPRWRALLRHAIREARRLGLEVDLTTGSGWPWGGPGLDERHTAHKLVIETSPLDPGALHPPPGVIAVTVYDRAAPLDPARVLAPDPSGDYQVPVMDAGDWCLLVARAVPTGQNVKRASPGAQGRVVDHFSRGAVRAFLERFDPLLRDLGADIPRAAFTDSYEVYGADWTPGLLEAFRRARGYDLAPWLHRLEPEPVDSPARHLIHDYRQTLREMQHAAVETWTHWCRAHGMASRLQAHGSPGCLLDLYALSDMPETEAYGREGVIERFAKVAASAAHLAGRPVCSAEAFTWLEDHFLASPDRLRHEADRFFLSGVNQLVAHGVPSGAEGLPFPGQLFYAGTDINEHMPWFGDLAPLTVYLARCQAALRWGVPDQDVLLFLPIHDVLSERRGDLERSTGNRLRLESAHNTESWLESDVPATAAAAEALEAGGFAYDLVSDQGVRALSFADGRLRAAGGSYAALVFAGPCRADGATLAAAAALARAGARVWISGEPPGAIPETGDPRDAAPPADPDAAELARTADRARDAARLAEALERAGVRHERLPGFRWVRRALGGRTLYFLKRVAAAGDHRGVISLAAAGRGAHVQDPVTGVIGVAETRTDTGGTGLSLDVEAGGVRVVILEPDALPGGAAPRIAAVSASPVVTVGGPWRLEWVDYGGLERGLTLASLADWTRVPELELYSGHVTYTASFSWPGNTRVPCTLDLGELHVTARVTLNGVDLGTAWTRPFRLDVAPGHLRASNTIRIRVANLAANRIIAMDRAATPWRRFYITGLGGAPFDARDWAPVPSGLLGPVTLRAL